MNFEKYIETLRETTGTTLGSPISEEQLKTLEDSLGVHLPTIHRDLLKSACGIETSGGYLRLFGTSTWQGIHLDTWNEPSLWKFCWAKTVNDYLCFGETAIGDQLSYKYSDLAEEGSDPPVYFLSYLDMSPIAIAHSFSEYLIGGFKQNTNRLLNDDLREVRERLGELLPTENLIQIPSFWISSGQVISELVVKMSSVEAMIMNGDVWRQVEALEGDVDILTTETYVDEHGRHRLHLVVNPSL